jgi:hypothetical protein
MEAVVPNWKKFRFKIDGKVNGVEMTPYTIPMARLAVYIADLAQLMGHKESVHLISVEDGSTQPLIYIDSEEESRVMHRVRNAQRGLSTEDANSAYKKIDSNLREDDATGVILNVDQKADVIEFPGRKANLPDEYGPIREQASIVGELKRVGGFRPDRVPIHLQRADEAIFYCDAAESIARELGPLLYRVIRVHGIATYSRGKEGLWIVDRFRIQSYDPEPLSNESFSTTIDKLRAIPGSQWAEMDDPLEELRKIRNGEESVAQ